MLLIVALISYDYSVEHTTGKLVLICNLSHAEMDINGTIYAHCIIKNVGDSTVRIIDYKPIVRILDSNDSFVEAWYDSAGAPVYSDEDLILLEPGGILEYNQTINVINYKFPGPGNYTVYATYSSEEGLIVGEHPPIWEGSLISNKEKLVISRI